MKRKILITGGTGLIGSELVKKFAEDDFHVLFTSRSIDNAKRIKKSIPEADYLIVDFTDNESFEFFKNNLSKDHPDISYLINNARNIDNLELDDDGRCSSTAMNNEYYMNVIVPYNLSNYLYDSFTQLEAIVNVSSQYSLVAPNSRLYKGANKSSPIQYNSSKASLNHLTKELAVKYVQKNVRVNCVAFGGFSGRVSKEFEARYSDISPGKRMLDIKEAYGPIKFLIDSDSLPINGQTIIADAGWTLW